MDPLLGPARLDPESISGSSDLPGMANTTSGIAAQLGDSSAQTVLDTWLQQLQTDETEEPVVESRLDIDSLLSSELEFDLDFLTELSSLKGAGSGDGGVSLQDLELGFLCSPGAPLEPEPVDLGSLSGPELFPEQPPATSTAPETARPGSAASESASSRTSAGERPGSGSAPPRPPPVASISVVTNKQQGKTVITISTPRGRQSFVLPTADLTQASRVLRALQQKRRQSRAAAAATASATATATTTAAAATTTTTAAAPEAVAGTDFVEKDGEYVTTSPVSSRKRPAPVKRKKSYSDMKDGKWRLVTGIAC